MCCWSKWPVGQSDPIGYWLVAAAVLEPVLEPEPLPTVVITTTTKGRWHVTTPGPEGPGFSPRNESFLFPTGNPVRSAGPTRKSSGASCDGGLVIAADREQCMPSNGIGQASDPALKGQICPDWINLSRKPFPETR